MFLSFYKQKLKTMGNPLVFGFIIFTSLVVLLIHNKNPDLVSRRKDGFEEKSKFKDDLKELSVILQNKMRELGQQSCRNTTDVSVNGGWCLAISGKNSFRHYTDEKLVPYLSKILEGKS